MGGGAMPPAFFLQQTCLYIQEFMSFYKLIPIAFANILEYSFKYGKRKQIDSSLEIRSLLR